MQRPNLTLLFPILSLSLSLSPHSRTPQSKEGEVPETYNRWGLATETERHWKTEENLNPVLHNVAFKEKKKEEKKMAWCCNRLLNKVFLSPGPLYFSPKCRKHVYRLYHHTRDCTIPACKPHSTPTGETALFVSPTANRSQANLSFRPLFSLSLSFLRLQEMCEASHATSRQPAVHGGVAHMQGTATHHSNTSVEVWGEDDCTGGLTLLENQNRTGQTCDTVLLLKQKLLVLDSFTMQWCAK